MGKDAGRCSEVATEVFRVESDHVINICTLVDLQRGQVERIDQGVTAVWVCEDDFDIFRFACGM